MTEQALQIQEKNAVAQATSEQLISAENAYRPDVDIYHTPEAFVFLVDLPGVHSGDIELEVNERNTLILRARNSLSFETDPVFAQTRFSNYYRAFELGDGIDREQISAHLEQGVLEVRIAKRESAKPRKIAIQV